MVISVACSKNLLQLGPVLILSLFDKIYPIKLSWVDKKLRSSHMFINVVLLWSSNINWGYCSKKSGTRLFWQWAQYMRWHFPTFVILLSLTLTFIFVLSTFSSSFSAVTIFLKDCSYTPFTLVFISLNSSYPKDYKKKLSMFFSFTLFAHFYVKVVILIQTCWILCQSPLGGRASIDFVFHAYFL